MENKNSQILQSGKNVIAIETNEIRRLSDRLNQGFVDSVLAILECPGKVVVSGMGKSGHIGKKIAATLASTGTPSFFMHPAEAFHGDLGMIAKNDIFLAISNSGETEEIIRLIPAIQRNKNRFIAMCGKPNSTLVRNADFFLDISVTKEACPLELAPTSSTTATLVMGDALAMAIMEQRNFQPENFALFHPGGSLGRKLLTKVKDVMRSDNLPFAALDDLLEEVIFIMTKSKLGLALICKDQKLIGVVTDGDLRRAWQAHKTLSGLSVKDIMSYNPKTIDPDTKLVNAEEVLMANKITTLIVVENDFPVGVLQVYNLES